MVSPLREVMDHDVFHTHRPLLFSVAYRMLGSASDAEDVLQDAWVRYRAVDRSTVRAPKAFATTIVTRLCLDRLKSARATREEYIGPWLPEPVLTCELGGPDSMVERAESVTLAFLVLLEQLSPQERAVLVLKDVFEYDHSEVADMLGITTEHSRQLLHRAKARLANKRPLNRGTPQSRRTLAERFARAFAGGDAAELTALLAQDVGMWSDGGGKVSAARRPVIGRGAVVNFLVGLHRTAASGGLLPHLTLDLQEVNGEPALIVSRRAQLESIFVLSVDNGTISAIRAVRNPDKLAHLDRQLARRH